MERTAPSALQSFQPARAAASLQRAAYAANRVESQSTRRVVFGFPAWVVCFSVFCKTWYSPAGLLAWPFASSGGGPFLESSGAAIFLRFFGGELWLLFVVFSLIDNEKVETFCKSFYLGLNANQR
jgi:hypothetical protein